MGSAEVPPPTRSIFYYLPSAFPPADLALLRCIDELPRGLVLAAGAVTGAQGGFDVRLDAELGGELKLTGPISNVSPVSSFQLRRGGLDVIGQHINLDRGTVMLTGDLNPTIDFAATTHSRTLTVTAEVT